MVTAMARPAKPYNVNEMFFLIAVMVMRFRATLNVALGAIRGSCQQPILDGSTYGNTATGEHSGMFNVSIAPSLFVVLVPFLDLFRILGLVFSFNYSTLVTIEFLPFSVIGMMVCWVFVGHTTILA